MWSKVTIVDMSITLIAFAAVCDVVRSQPPEDSYKPSELLIEAMEDAIKGAAVLGSLVDPDQRTDTVPNFQDLNATVEKVSSAAWSIGRLFSLTQQLVSTGKTMDIETIDQYYKEVNINVGQLQFTEDGLRIDDAHRAILMTYKHPHDQLADVYKKYNEYINNIANSTYKDKFESICNDHSVEPGGSLENIRDILTLTGTSESITFRKVLQNCINYDYRVLKRFFQLIMMDASRATMMKQACLGTIQSSVIDQSRAAEKTQNDIRQIVIEFESLFKHLMDQITEMEYPFKRYAETEINGRIDRSIHLPMANTTTELKHYLIAKYPYLLWNIFVYRANGTAPVHPSNDYGRNTLGQFAGIIHHAYMFQRNVMTFFKDGMVVSVVWAHMRDYADEKFWFHTYQMQMHELLYQTGCHSGTATSFAKHYRSEFDYLRVHIPFIFAGESTGAFFTDTADNAVEFEICDIYIAGLLA